MSMGLQNGEKPVAQLWCCHVLHTTDGNPCSKEQLLLMLCIQLRLESRSLHKRKPTPFKHVFIEIVNTTKVHRQT